MKHSSAALLVFSLGCTGSASSYVGDPQAAPPVAEASTLGVNDVFEVRVYNEPELSGIYRVDSEGGISLPLAGRVDVAGLTPSAVAGELEVKFADYLKSPQVTVFVTEFNSKKIYVLGQVKTPGTFVYEDGMTVVQAITLAGGFGPLAEANGIFVTRLVEGKEKQIQVPVEDIGQGLARNFTLIPGDIVYVPESLF
ncbi:MAG: polysaccharide biosynthesis/export family protein [Myxococcota bacterium]